MTRTGLSRVLSPTLLAFIVAGVITAGLAYMVLSSNAAESPRPDPAGTAIAAPTEQALTVETPTPTPLAAPQTPTAVVGLVLDRARDDLPAPAATEPAAPPTVAAPTPTPRVINVVPPTAPPPTAVPPTMAAPTAAPQAALAPEALPTAVPMLAAENPAPTPYPTAPTPAVAVIPVAPVDQAPPTVVPSAPAPTGAPAVAADSAATEGGDSDGDAGAVRASGPLLFPTAVPLPATAAERTTSGDGGGSPGGIAPVASGGGSQAPANDAQAMIDPMLTPAPVAGAEPNDQPDPGVAPIATVAPAVAARDQAQSRVAALRECIETRARGSRRDRNRDRDTTQSQSSDPAAPGDCADDINGSTAQSRPGEPSLGDQIENDVDAKIDAAFEKAGLDRDD